LFPAYWRSRFASGSPVAADYGIKKSDCDRLIYAQHIESQGIGFFEEIRARDLEGIVCKRKRSIYKSNGSGWLKVKNPNYSQAKGRHDLFKGGA